MPGLTGDEYDTPAAIKKLRLAALVDTGATTSILGLDSVKKLALLSQSQKKILFPNTPIAEYHPSFACELFFPTSFTDQGPPKDWPDLVDMVGYDLSGRIFQAVIGMDILRKGTLLIDKGGAVSFKY